MLADAHLTELDLSDNAFGPIGIEGLAALLMSQTCYSLEILKLENNGLGITGGKVCFNVLTYFLIFNVQIIGVQYKCPR